MNRSQFINRIVFLLNVVLVICMALIFSSCSESARRAKIRADQQEIADVVERSKMRVEEEKQKQLDLLFGFEDPGGFVYVVPMGDYKTMKIGDAAILYRDIDHGLNILRFARNSNPEDYPKVIDHGFDGVEKTVIVEYAVRIY